MPSSYTPSLRLEMQFTGENVNVWGDRLNTVLLRVDQAIAGMSEIALTGDYALTVSTSGADEARSGILKFTGGVDPKTITLPSLSKAYRVWNATSGPLTFTTGVGATVVIDAGDRASIFCDGSAVYTDALGGLTVRQYIDAAVVGGPGAVVPSVAGNSGKFLTNDGLATFWRYPASTDLSDLTAFVTAREDFALAMALVF
jgi:hypothetical protein